MLSYLKFEKLKMYTVMGWMRYIKLKILDRYIIISGKCKKCGACCRNLSIDIEGKWLRSVTQFKKLVKENPAYKRFKIIGRGLNGYLIFNCEWLKKDGTCKDHKNRLPFCRKYPEKELYFTGGELNKKCGYRFDEVVNFESLLKDD